MMQTLARAPLKFETLAPQATPLPVYQHLKYKFCLDLEHLLQPSYWKRNKLTIN